MSSYLIKEQINDLEVLMKDKDEPKCIEMLNELAKMEEFDVNVLYIKKSRGEYSSLLHKSFEYGLLKVSKHLIKYLKANVNILDFYGETALHIASSRGHIDIVRHLIYNTNINVNIQNVYGNTALHEASIFGHIDIVRYLIENTNIDVNIKNKNGYTALHEACYWNKCGVVLELLKGSRVDVFIENNRNETAEQVARNMGYYYTAESIANYEPDVNVFDNK